MNFRSSFVFKHIGFELPFGPNNAAFKSLSCGSTYIEQRSLKKKWKDIMNEYHGRIEDRDITTFFKDTTLKQKQTNPTVNRTAMNFPSLDTKDNFNYDDLILSDVVPYQYQLLAYIDCLLRDTIVVMPTGIGKTLVGSLVLRRFSLIDRRHRRQIARND